MRHTMAGRLLRAERLQPALHRRVVSTGEQDRVEVLQLALLTTGRLTLTDAAEGTTVVEPPALLLFGASARPRLVLDAGSRLFIVVVGRDDLSDAVGDDPDGADVLYTLSQPAILTELEPLGRRGLERAIDGLGEELETQAPSWMVVSAQLRLIAVHAWRASGRQQKPGGPRSDAISILQRFRQLVEQEFRRQQPVSYYAGQLGVTADRLHAVATRHLGRAPLDLIHDRLAQEARTRLERSTLSVQSISDGLNFKDPAHFSRFFKRKTGLSPLRYRLSLRNAPRTAGPREATDYHEWP